jgi:N-methylhydantoinase B
VRSVPVEIVESIAPVVIWRKEYRIDSGGPGRQRGGLGQVMEIASAENAPFSVYAMFERIEHPAHGREGGLDGAPGRIALVSGTPMRGKGQQTVPPGECLRLELPGGGGFGDPRERATAAVQADLRDGLVSAQAAAAVYGLPSGGRR